MLTPCYGFTKATPEGVYDVFAPTAYESNGVDTLHIDYAKMLDGSPAMLQGTGAYVLISNFTDPYHYNYWSPYSNRSAFPPANATILTVSIISIVRCGVARPFIMSVIFGEGSNYSSTQSPIYNAGVNDQLYTYNITDEMTEHGILTNWSTSSFTVYVIAGEGGTHALYVDYVGLSYTWAYPGEDEGGTGGPGWTPGAAAIDVPGIMGITGFIGMIAVPAAGVWVFRKDGGSKILAAMGVLVAFLVCFALFLGAMG